MGKTALPTVEVSRLRPGVYVHLNIPWLEHPFWFNSFLIQNEEQLRELQALGIAAVQWDPQKRRVQPLPPQATAAASTVAAVERAAVSDRLRRQLEEKKRQKQRQREEVIKIRQNLARCTESYAQTIARSNEVFAALERASPHGVVAARAVADEAAQRFTPQTHVVLQLITEHAGEESAATHAVNVMVLAMMLAHRLGFKDEMLAAVGMAALVHDIGKARIPTAVLLNPQRNHHEESLYRLHPEFGDEILQQIPTVPPVVRQWVRLHHERVDGKGFPLKLFGEAVPVAAQVIGLANRFDNLCNPVPGVKPKTPSRAIAWLFRHERSAWREDVFAAFVRLIGVYPPGSFVRLSNDAVGLVLRNSDDDPLRPLLMLFEPDAPRGELPLVDLSTMPDWAIVEALSPEQLPPEVVEKLDPRQKVRYFHDVLKR